MTATIPHPYQRLPGRGARRQAMVDLMPPRCTLWLGHDHLLSVETTAGCREDYRRFYYHEIQALDLEVTGRYARLAAMLAGAAVVPLILGLASGELIWRGFWWAFGALMLLVLLGHLALGPTCACRIRTAVHLEPLPSLGRLRHARRAFDRLRERIERAQDRIAPEDLTRLAASGDGAAAAGGPPEVPDGR